MKKLIVLFVSLYVQVADECNEEYLLVSDEANMN